MEVAAVGKLNSVLPLASLLLIIDSPTEANSNTLAVASSGYVSHYALPPPRNDFLIGPLFLKSLVTTSITILSTSNLGLASVAS